MVIMVATLAMENAMKTPAMTREMALAIAGLMLAIDRANQYRPIGHAIMQAADLVKTEMAKVEVLLDD